MFPPALPSSLLPSPKRVRFVFGDGAPRGVCFFNSNQTATVEWRPKWYVRASRVPGGGMLSIVAATNTQGWFRFVLLSCAPFGFGYEKENRPTYIVRDVLLVGDGVFLRLRVLN